MARPISGQISGALELNGRMKKLAKEVRFKLGRSALRKAAKVVADAMVANAKRIDDPATADDISKNVAIRWDNKAYKKTKMLYFRVGILGGASPRGMKKKSTKPFPGGDTTHWRMLEFGTQHTRAQPFARKSLADNIGRATTEFTKSFNKAITRYVKRQQKKAKASVPTRI